MSVLDAVVIGGGISGLSAAHFLKKRGKNILLCEKGKRTGGSIETISEKQFLCELGPNTLRGLNRAVSEIISDVGLEKEIIFPSALSKKRFIYTQGRCVPAKRLLIRYLLHLLREPFQKKGPSDETVLEFFRRRLGAGITETLIDPFVSGIYGGAIDQMSVKATFTQLKRWEQEHGGLLKGLLFSKKDSRDKRLFSFREGLEALPRAIESRLGPLVSTETTLLRLDRKQEHLYELTLLKQGESLIIQTRSVIVATPATVASEMIQRINPSLATKLLKIPYAPLVVYHFGFHKDQLKYACQGFGLLIPRREGMRTLGILFSSSLFPNRAPQDHHLLTVIVGGMNQLDLFEQEAHELFHQVYCEVTKILKIKGDPVFGYEKRYLKAIPQYFMGHPLLEDDVKRFNAQSSGILIIGNYINGPSVPQCIENSKNLLN